MVIMKWISIMILASLMIGCQNPAGKDTGGRAVLVNYNQDKAWKELWYDGNAEINVYETQQARYQDIHPGHTVLIFVTEDFLTDKQVKNETYTSDASTSVLKTNQVIKFETGVYDYSIMTSVFSPVEKKKYPRTLKITTSSQDWCGQSYTQLNHAENSYRVSQFSYFESEGDRQFSVDDLLTEDEIFNQIRLNPGHLPTGEKAILPGTVFTRLKHIEYKPYPVQLTRNPFGGTGFPGDNLEVYQVIFPEFDRTLEIIYESDFPYHIAGWTDTYAVASGEKLTSISKRISTKRMPYWSQHDLEDHHLRAELGL